MRFQIRFDQLVSYAILLFVLPGCAASGRPGPPATGGAAAYPAALPQLPASFAGEIPCADCPGIVYRLDLFPDHTFFQSLTYEDREFAYYDIGLWHLHSESAVLTLAGEGERPSLIRVADSSTLRLLDAEGREITSGLNYTLKRTPHFERIEPRLKLSGMYRYMADAALFTECRTGLRLPVAQEADNVALERGYLSARREPGEEVLITLEGTIALRPAVDSDTLLRTLIPNHFISASPGATCESAAATGAEQEERPGPPSMGEAAAVPLEGTAWKLVVLAGKTISTRNDERAPTITLDPNDQRASGAGGCNLFGGSYTLKGDELSFGPLISTKMYCEGVMNQEQAYFAALEATRGWRVSGRELELTGVGGEVLARFEAGEPR
jgi:copper homeostasis protein (lipoprotein)